MAGYSDTPLSKKLGIKAGFRLYIKNAPSNYFKQIEPLPEGVKVLSRISNDLDIIHFFTLSKSEIITNMALFISRLSPGGVIWLSWPKKTSKVSTDLSVNTIRDTVHVYGFVDIKICAVDDTWSGLKLVKRKRNIKLSRKGAL